MNLLLNLKENNEDYEWYPTTREILQTVAYDIENSRDYYTSSSSILDVGAGNGSSLVSLKELLKDKVYVDLYAIEKSQILINAMSEDIFVIGTEFHEQTFIDKKHTNYFCNPPYSEYEQWTIKLMREGNFDRLYLVIPERWEDNPKINKAIEDRGLKVKSLGKFSFDLWFDSHFSIKAEKSSSISSIPKPKENDVTTKKVSIPQLAALYKKDFEKMLSNYKALENLDHSLFKEMNVDIRNLKEGMRKKIEGLKNLYWKELFSSLDSLTDRLTSKSRERLLEKLSQNTSVDFTESNAYSVVIWALKNANKYFDSQLLDVYWSVTRAENVINYKSNKRIIKDSWRFSRDEISHYKLDYRIIDRCYNAVSAEYNYQQTKGLHNNAHTKISDIFTIAKNLGFDITESSEDKEWKAGKKNLFYLEDGELFAEIKAFKNGNIHMKLNQKFMRMWNIEASRLNKWVKSPEEAAEEMSVPLAEARESFKSNIQLFANDIPMIEKTS